MTALKQKYAQVSDGCWRSRTAVQVGSVSGPFEFKICVLEPVFRANSLFIS